MGTTSDGIDRLITEPRIADLLEIYFANEGSFAGYHFDDVGENPSNAFTEGDLLAVSFLDVTFPPPAAIALLDPNGPWEHLLRDVGDDALLWKASDLKLAAATQLWSQVMELPGVGSTKAGKLLARKRPHLLPIYDSVVAEFLGPAPGEFWADLRAALKDEQRRNGIGAWTNGLNRPITTLRALDVALWMRCANARSATAARASVGLPAQPLRRSPLG